MKLRFLVLTIVIMLLCAFIWREVRAETIEPDIIVLDDNCRLIKKASKPIIKKKSFVIQYAKPASAPQMSKVKRKPLFKHDVPADYDLNCTEDEPHKAPPLIVDAAPPDIHFCDSCEPLLSEYAFPETPFTALATVPKVTTDDDSFVGSAYGPTYIALGGPVLIAQAPISAVPEPKAFLLMLTGLGLLVFVYRWRRP